MKILHVISLLGMGGAQRLLSDFLPLMAKDNEVALLVNNNLDNEFSFKIQNAGIKIMQSGCELRSIRNIICIANLSKDYDIVHVHLFPAVWWAAFASLISSMRLVYTEHSTSNRRRGKWYLRPIEKFVYSRYKKIISISQQTQDALTRWLEIKKEDSRFVVVNNGVNLASYKDLKGESLYPHTLIMVSRFAASKDQKTVIRALRLLPENVHVIFVGDGEKLEDCKKYVDDNGLFERTHFVGRQSDVAAWISKADIGIQSSYWEGFGLTAVELMAAGKPVVATNVDGLKQVVEGAGELFPVGDEGALAVIVKKLLDNKNYYDEICRKCQLRAEQFDIHIMAKSYISLYRGLIESK